MVRTPDANRGSCADALPSQLENEQCLKPWQSIDFSSPLR